MSSKTKFYILAVAAIVNVCLMFITEVHHIYYLENEQTKLLGGAYGDAPIDVEHYIFTLCNGLPILLLLVEIVLLALLLTLRPNTNQTVMPASPVLKFREKLLDALSPVVYVIVFSYSAILAFFVFAASASYASELSRDLSCFDTLNDIESVIDLLDYFVDTSKCTIKYIVIELAFVVFFIYLKSRSMHLRNHK